MHSLSMHVILFFWTIRILVDIIISPSQLQFGSLLPHAPNMEHPHGILSSQKAHFLGDSSCFASLYGAHADL